MRVGRSSRGPARSAIVWAVLVVAPMGCGDNSPDDTYSTDEDTTLSVAAPGVLGNDSDPDGDALTAVLVSGPSSAASFTLNADGSFEYAPAVDFHGTDSFTYKANDGSLDSNVATVTITVSSVNDVPLANEDDYSTDENTTLSVAAPGVLDNDSDPDGDAVTAVLKSGPSSAASFTLNADGSFEYTPAANFSDEKDSFTYKTDDGSLESSETLVTITVYSTPP